MDTLYIVMPAYNEEENIKNVVKEWYEKLDGKSLESKLVIAPSGSTDSTYDILKCLTKEMPKLCILDDTEKQHGPKVIALYKYAIMNNADYIFQTDSDGQTNPKEFDSFWKVRKKYNVILGYRSSREDGKSRAFVEKVVCILLKLYFGVKIPDANAPFRLMKTDIVKKYIDKMPYDYNIPNIMFTTYFKKYNESITFKKITFKARQGGVNSINIPKIVRIGFKALKDFRMFKKDMKKNKEDYLYE